MESWWIIDRLFGLLILVICGIIFYEFYFEVGCRFKGFWINFYSVCYNVRIYLESFEFVVCFRVEFVGCDFVGG